MSFTFVIILSIIFSAFFSGMEIAFVSSNKLRLELDRQSKSIPSRILDVFVNFPSNYIATMLVGNNISLVIYGYFMAILLEPTFASFIHSEINMLLVQTFVSTLIILVTAEFLPKTIFRINPNSMLYVFAIPVGIFYVLLYPITKLTIWISDFMLKRIFKSDMDNSISHNFFGKIDLNNLVNEANDGSIEEQTNESDIKLFQNALDFSNVKIRDCMVPRTEIIALDNTFSYEDLKQKFIETGLSKIIIFKDSIDDILGYIHSKDLFKKPTNLDSIIRELNIVPETMPANKLLRKFIQENRSTSIVVDEFGGVSGMVTIEDLIEEIFGEIEDEHDTSLLIEKQVNDHSFILSGRHEIDYINDKYKIDIPSSDEYDTIAGFIFYHYENLPNINETITIDNFTFKVLKMSRTRIEIIKLDING